MPQRRATFLLGRYAAKSALSGLRPGLHPDEVEVSPGSFAQPVVRGVPNCNVSLSHSGGTAVAIAFGSEILMGIDLELRSEARVRRVQRLLKLDREMPLGSEALPSDVLPLALWTAIEALSKALRCGLTVPLEVFAVSRVDRLRCSFAEKTVGSAHLQFREFGAFEAQTWWSNHEVISVVYPRHIRHEFSLPSALRLHGQGLGVSFVRYSI